MYARTAALLCAVALAGFLLRSSRGRAARRCNVVLVSIDSLRADHLGCYGYPAGSGAPTSPHLDRLASEGVLFEHAQSTTSWTMPSHHALFSGRPDLAHGAVSDENGPTLQRVDLAQVLADAGYATAGFFSGPYLDPRYGFGGGFELYENLGPEDELSSHQASSAKRVSDRAIGWLDDHARAEPPFFLFLHYFDVHYDYSPPEEGYARRFWPGGRRPRIGGDGFFENAEIHAGMEADDLAGVVACYDGEILWTDEQVGRVLDRLEALHLADDTLVVVVSDHGDEFFEHGAKGHRQNLFEPTLHVALIARLPGRLPAGRRVPQRVSIVDVAPTVLDLCGALEKADFHAADAKELHPGDLDHGMWGRSVLPLVDGRERADRDCLGFLANRWQDPDHAVDTWALWTGSTKVVVSKRYDWIRDEAGAKVGLKTIERTGRVFDLARDPGELHDLAASRDPAAAAAIARFDAVFAESSALSRVTAALEAGPPPAPLTEAQRLALEQLGYTAGSTPPPRLPPGTRLKQRLPPMPQFPRRE